MPLFPTIPFYYFVMFIQGNWRISIEDFDSQLLRRENNSPSENAHFAYLASPKHDNNHRKSVVLSKAVFK